jgi:hypothetical protein
MVFWFVCIFLIIVQNIFTATPKLKTITLLKACQLVPQMTPFSIIREKTGKSMGSLDCREQNLPSDAQKRSDSRFK